ncbi:MAG: putative Ig domain-containing protein [Ignavibacteriae bacterium]|nr:putative Ig domain-containing protein [Ignavibacteriota bacterium]
MVTFNDQSIEIKWVDNSKTETNYIIERKEGNSGSWSERGRVDANVVTYKDINLAPNTTYCYRVRAYNGNGSTYSGYSNEVCATTLVQRKSPTITSTAVTNGVVGQLYSYNVDATGNPAPTYSLTTSPSGMTINSTSGIIQWTPSSSGSYNVTVKATNGVSPDASQSFTIVVALPNTAPVITTAAVTNGVVGQMYSYDVDATGNPAPTYSLTTSPSGMTINSTSGLIQWTPSSSGSYNVTVKASNGVSPDASQSFTIVVALPNTAPVITTAAVTNGVVGQLYSYDVDATGNPAPTYSLTTSPSGMTINSTSGLIQWTPSSSGSYNVTVKASNGVSPDASQSFTIVVALPNTAPVITTAAVTNGVVGQLYSYNVDATGNPAPTYSLTTSPSGMTINSTSGIIQWTPSSSGSYNVTVKATNGVSPDASQSFIILVPGLEITPTNQLVSFTSGSTTFNVSSNISWSVSTNENWITGISPSSGKNNETITVNYAENLGSQRVGTIIISGGGLTKSVTVTQAEGPILTVIPSNKDVEYIAGSTTFNVSSNISWSVSTNENWITSLIPSNAALTVQYTENKGIQRVGVITVSGSGLTSTVTITQAENPPKLLISQGEISHQFGSFAQGSNPEPNNFNFELKNSGGGILFGTISFSGIWLTIDYNEFSLNADESKSFNVTANTSNLEIGEYSDSLKIFSNAGNLNGEISCNLITGIDDLSKIGNIPEDYYIDNNYPNPFNPTTIISFGLPEQSTVSLVVYDITGNEVEKFLNNERLAAGRYQYSFDSKKLASGIYFYRILAEKFVQTKKMILMK